MRLALLQLRPIYRLAATNLGKTRTSFQFYSTKSKPLEVRPSPPRLPKEDQAEFERLQKEAMSSFNKVDINEDIEHPQFRKPYADFEGDVNPETGEVGGPKQDPLRFGDYSFNGRVTDF
ncbi:Sdh8p [Sugiyamaella lignohabitans]|uniref:Succinate dehydrogenase assembly factor 4, mitochondrial n=1 Tax=Sugiyamaella lignohabitans TaxID=796027 RepID=A0A167DJS8_9ASCO|nr:Sdh8p [Sugiyamaella lignohabitans]ANB12991.1 Sdh8p [Sugiyamaella lignohabitans]